MALNRIPTGAGPMREILAFEKREFVIDAYGNSVGDWVEVFRAAAALDPRQGGEAVMSARLSGLQPYDVAIRYTTTAAAVSSEWRCRDVRTGKVYAIKSAVPNSRRSYIDLLVVEGEAA